jgi:beta-lactamase regulating signal transducer with metallopeptidase domain
MIERTIEFLANAVWQLPLLAAGAWWLLRSARFGPKAQYRVWIGVLGLGVLLPLARVAPVAVSAPRSTFVRPETAVLDMEKVQVRPEPLHFSEPRKQVRASGSKLSWAHGILRRHNLRISAAAAQWFAGVYMVTLLLGSLRMLRAWGVARRVVQEAQPVVLVDRAQRLLEECGQLLGVSLPQVAESDAVSTPAVVGLVAPVLLLPEAFQRYPEEEMRAALLHELAHIRRRDYAANVLCEMVALPLVWHPVAYAVQGRIRSTREMACDAMAAAEMPSPVVYARSLLTLASGRFGGMDSAGFMAVGLFTNNNLEERVMQLTETKQAMGVRAKAVRVTSAVAGMAAVIGLAAMLHVTPALAQAAAQPTPPVQAAPATGDAQAVAAPVPVTSGQAVPPEDVSTDGLAQGTAAGTSAGAGQGSSEGASGADRAGATSAGGLNVGLTPSDVIEDVDKNCPMGHGTNVHHWTTSEGKQFSIVNCEMADPTPKQKKQYEEEFKKQAADLDRLKVEDLKLDDLKVLKDVDQVKLQQQLAKLQSPEFQMQLKLRLDDLQQHMGDLKINDVELQKQLGKLNSEDMQKQMATLQKQIAESGLRSADVQKQLEKLDSVEMKKQIAELDQQLRALTRQDIQKVVNDEVRKQVEEQLKEAQKHLDEARTEIEKDRARATEHPAAPCTEPCSAQPQ